MKYICYDGDIQQYNGANILEVVTSHFLYHYNKVYYIFD